MRQDRKKSDGAAQFEDYYQAIWADRWPSLRAALLEQRQPAAFSDGLEKPYYMDEASILTASLLPLHEGCRVLDMCAAPGGKTLVLASRLAGRGSIVANDRSRDRKARLDRVLDEHLGPGLRKSVKSTCRDASKWGLYEKEAYDSILLDAPCSSERHVISSPGHLSIWSPRRPRRLAIEQYALLSSAFMALREGGYLLYSTCSVNPGEDEEVIARLFKKREGLVEEAEVNAEGAQKCPFGYIVLPDMAAGRGPMYYCLLRKREK